MRRALPLLLLLPFACDQEAKSKTAVARTNPGPPKPPQLPTTGNPKIREMREGILEEVERAEAALQGGTKPAAHLVANWKKGIDNLIAATQLAITNEAAETARRSLASLREQQAVLDKRRNDLAEGMLEIQRYLDEIARGIGKPPEGFTEDELKDRLGERQEQARALEKDEDELRSKMQEQEDVLTKGPVAPPGETLHTHELDALKELRVRIDALAAR